MRIHFIPTLLGLTMLTGCPALDAPKGSPPATGGGTRAAAPAPSGGRPMIALGSAAGTPGQVVDITATLDAGGASIAGTQNDIGYDPKQISIVPDLKGKPDCSRNKAIGKEGTAFSFQPRSCKAGAGCTGVRALVLSLSNVEAIPDGAALYTCKVQILPGATPGTHPLTLSKVGFSDPKGTAIDGGGGNGVITVRR